MKPQNSPNTKRSNGKGKEHENTNRGRAGVYVQYDSFVW